MYSRRLVLYKTEIYIIILFNDIILTSYRNIEMKTNVKGSFELVISSIELSSKKLESK
jgi:hypothetical protein